MSSQTLSPVYFFSEFPTWFWQWVDRQNGLWLSFVFHFQTQFLNTSLFWTFHQKWKPATNFSPPSKTQLFQVIVMVYHSKQWSQVTLCFLRFLTVEDIGLAEFLGEEVIELCVHWQWKVELTALSWWRIILWLFQRHLPDRRKTSSIWYEHTLHLLKLLHEEQWSRPQCEISHGPKKLASIEFQFFCGQNNKCKRDLPRNTLPVHCEQSALETSSRALAWPYLPVLCVDGS